MFFGVKCKTPAKHRYLHEFLGPTQKIRVFAVFAEICTQRIAQIVAFSSIQSLPVLQAEKRQSLVFSGAVAVEMFQRIVVSNLNQILANSMKNSATTPTPDSE